MKKSKFETHSFFLFAALLILTIKGFSQTPGLNPFGASVPCTKYLNINYAGSSNPLQTFDLYVPQVSLPGNAPKSIVVFIHGGGFISGDKQDTKDPSKKNKEVAALLNSNMAFLSMNYRLVKNNDALGIRKCLDDCKLCIKYLRANAASYGINPDKMAIWGSSAGSQLAMLIGFDVSVTPNYIKALLVDIPQASLDIEQWSSKIFASYCSTQQICDVLNAPQPPIFANYIRSIYGLGAGSNDCSTIISQSATIRAQLDILSKLDNVNDPPIWIQNNNPDNNVGISTCPTNRQLLNHHVKHALTLKNRAIAKSLEYYYQVNNGSIESSLSVNPYSNATQFLKAKLQ